ncbi:hypothetical protein B0H13DRAFT_2317921 [Mycena leptocephala]|nr:hypothetical protein B0H13DRAFT_2317921 [Mycena leptocephala]
MDPPLPRPPALHHRPYECAFTPVRSGRAALVPRLSVRPRRGNQRRHVAFKLHHHLASLPQRASTTNKATEALHSSRHWPMPASAPALACSLTAPAHQRTSALVLRTLLAHTLRLHRMPLPAAAPLLRIGIDLDLVQLVSSTSASSAVRERQPAPPWLLRLGSLASISHIHYRISCMYHISWAIYPAISYQVHSFALDSARSELCLICRLREDSYPHSERAALRDEMVSFFLFVFRFFFLFSRLDCHRPSVLSFVLLPSTSSIQLPLLSSIIIISTQCWHPSPCLLAAPPHLFVHSQNSSVTQIRAAIHAVPHLILWDRRPSMDVDLARCTVQLPSTAHHSPAAPLPVSVPSSIWCKYFAIGFQQDARRQ